MQWSWGLIPYRRIVSGCALTVMLLATTACGVIHIDLSFNSDSGKGIVGISLPTTSVDRWTADGTNLANAFQAMGYRPDVEYAQNDVSRQIAHISGMIFHNVKLLVIRAVDDRSLSSVLAKAARKNIPVLAYDQLIRYSSHVDYLAAFDSYQAGVLQARCIQLRLDLDQAANPPAIELFAGPTHDPNAKLLFSGAMSVLQPYLSQGRLVVPSGATTMEQVAAPLSDTTAAKRRMAGVLGTDYRSMRLDAVLAPSDDIAQGVIEALRFTGYGTPDRPLPIVTGHNAELSAVKRIIEGAQAQTVLRDTRTLAKAAADLGASLIDGKPPAITDQASFANGSKNVPAYLVAPVSVDRDNYADTLIASGYYDVEQLAS